MQHGEFREATNTLNPDLWVLQLKSKAGQPQLHLSPSCSALKYLYSLKPDLLSKDSNMHPDVETVSFTLCM